MLTQTSELAVRSLLLLAASDDPNPIPPRQLAKSLDCSPSYLAKTVAMLVRAGILPSVRGARGGVLLTRDSAQITLLEIVEACQGLLIGNYCTEIAPHTEPVCSFHSAMNDLHDAMTDALSKWTLKDLMRQPYSGAPPEAATGCKMKTSGVLPERVRIEGTQTDE